MEFQQLRYFVALGDSGSFTRAAEACDVSQPSLSQQIRKLEDEFRQPLVERLGRRTRLTDAGRTLLDHAKSILQEIDATHRQMAEQGAGVAGRLTFGVIPTVTPYLMPNVLKKFRDHYPNVELVVTEHFGRKLERAVAEGEMDLGVTSLPVEDERLESESLYVEPLLLALPRKHPLSRRQEVKIDDIHEEKFILLHEEHCLASTVERFCSESGFSPRLICRSAQLATVQELIAAGQGVSLLPALASRSDPSKGCVYRKIVPTPRRTVAVMWNPRRYQPPLATKFLGFLRNEAQEVKGAMPKKP